MVATGDVDFVIPRLGLYGQRAWLGPARGYSGHVTTPRGTEVVFTRYCDHTYGVTGVHFVTPRLGLGLYGQRAWLGLGARGRASHQYTASSI